MVREVHPPRLSAKTRARSHFSTRLPLVAAGTLIVDDSAAQTGKQALIPPSWRMLIEDSKIKPMAPPQGDRGRWGVHHQSGE
jgi:hypothetical protein